MEEPWQSLSGGVVDLAANNLSWARSRQPHYYSKSLATSYLVEIQQTLFMRKLASWAY